MSVLLDIKKFVATSMGKSDYATADAKRSIAINQARREFYSHRKWKFAKIDATLTFSSGEVNFPSNFDPGFNIGEIYSYSGTDKTTYIQVNQEDLSKYESNSTEDYVFAIDSENSKIKSNQQSATPIITYYQIPDDKALDTSDDSDVEIAPTWGIVCINLLSTAMTWLLKERDEDEYNRFYVRYEKALKHAEHLDNISRGQVSTGGFTSNYDLGY